MINDCANSYTKIIYVSDFYREKSRVADHHGRLMIFISQMKCSQQIPHNSIKPSEYINKRRGDYSQEGSVLQAQHCYQLCLAIPVCIASTFIRDQTATTIQVLRECIIHLNLGQGRFSRYDGSDYSIAFGIQTWVLCELFLVVLKSTLWVCTYSTLCNISIMLQASIIISQELGRSSIGIYIILQLYDSASIILLCQQLLVLVVVTINISYHHSPVELIQEWVYRSKVTHGLQGHIAIRS